MKHTPPRRAVLNAARVLAIAFVGLSLGAHAAAAAQTVELNGRSYVNHGLVGVGRVAASLKDKFGETHGSFSAFTVDPGTWQRNADGSFSGVLLTQPDRGYNIAATTNYVPRYNEFTFTFTPAPAGAATQDQVKLTLANSIKFTEADGTPFTSFDPTPSGVGTRAGFPALPQAFNGRLSLDAEGIVVLPDNTLAISDEYGPYVWKFSRDGKLQSVIQPPAAVLPRRNGELSFASNNPPDGKPAPTPANPVTGRQNNQGMEGLSLSPDGRTLFVLLQSAARQDGGTGGTGPRRNTRLFAYDMTGSAGPVLTGEYVIQLPQFVQGTTTRAAAQSELLAVSSTQFLVLARDGNGRGTATPTSIYRRIVLYDISGATNIAGTAYDAADGAIAPGGNLVAAITPATSRVLIDMNDAAELAKFGLHNGPTEDVNNLSEKWEALSLVPALDPAARDDWFLFVGNDNDFITQSGFQDGMAYADASGIENDCMVLVYRLTIPSRLSNLSTLAQVSPSHAATAGFVVEGSGPRRVLIRGVGPALASFNVTAPLADPMLTLRRNGVAGEWVNQNWGDQGQTSANEIMATAGRVGAFALTAGSKDAALLVTLDPGVYTAQLSSADGSSGTALVEIYQLP